jgi:hypothetical protein
MKSECWETMEVQPGPTMNWQLSLPDLEALKLPFGEPIPLEIHWTLYSDDRKVLSTSKAKITLQD